MRAGDTYEKLAAAGFVIVRPDDYPAPRIKQWVGDGFWKTLEKYPSKAARDRALAVMLENPKTVNL